MSTFAEFFDKALADTEVVGRGRRFKAVIRPLRALDQSFDYKHVCGVPDCPLTRCPRTR